MMYSQAVFEMIYQHSSWKSQGVRLERVYCVAANNYRIYPRQQWPITGACQVTRFASKRRVSMSKMFGKARETEGKRRLVSVARIVAHSSNNLIPSSPLATARRCLEIGLGKSLKHGYWLLNKHV